jgi:competence protein ComEA
VYELPADKRILDAVEAAGGALPTAELDQVNLARKLEDGEQIRIPPREGSALPLPLTSNATKEKSLSSSHTHFGASTRKMKGPKDGQIALNSADAQELLRLPGVGPATAQRIIQKRKELGGKYRYVEQLLEIRGIGPKKLAQMRPFLRL